jgi:hypothetical protein
MEIPPHEVALPSRQRKAIGDVPGVGWFHRLCLGECAMNRRTTKMPNKKAGDVRRLLNVEC